MIYTELMQENPAKRGMKVQSETDMHICVDPNNTKAQAAIAAALSRDGRQIARFTKLFNRTASKLNSKWLHFLVDISDLGSFWIGKHSQIQI